MECNFVSIRPLIKFVKSVTLMRFVKWIYYVSIDSLEREAFNGYRV